MYCKEEAVRASSVVTVTVFITTLILLSTLFNSSMLAAAVISLVPAVLTIKDPLIVTLGSSSPVAIKSSLKKAQLMK